jgi:WD40 repeat protein
MQILASASYDDTIKLYIDDPSDDWYCFSTLTGHASTVWSLAWSPTGSYLASGSDDRTVRIWKRVAKHKWENVLVLSGHERSVYSVSWGKGKGLAAAGEEYVGWLGSVGGDGIIRVWEVVEREGSAVAREIVCEKASHGVQDTNAVSFCGREGFEGVMATGGDDGWIRVWEIY